jgi:hypothetical protein
MATKKTAPSKSATAPAAKQKGNKDGWNSPVLEAYREKQAQPTFSGLENVGEDASRIGTHPNFDDLERVDALRKTTTRVRSDEDIALLHNLLSDAHERLEARGWEDGEVNEEQMNEQLAELQTQIETLEATVEEMAATQKKLASDCEDEVNAWEKENVALVSSARESAALAKLQQERIDWLDAALERGVNAENRVAELEEVEPLAMAFALLCHAGWDADALSDEQREIVKTAAGLLGVET